MAAKTLVERAKEYGEQFKDAPESSELSRSSAWLVGYRTALEEVLAGIDREQSYREYREDQDGSAIGACKEIAGYVRKMRGSDD